MKMLKRELASGMQKTEKEKIKKSRHNTKKFKEDDNKTIRTDNRPEPGEL